ncbi:phospholipid-translocating P-type ATPase [Diaporthe helianthi]|uniref:Phospholipid-transporting ATPase n=1 Tax=Diaporthe helianthi TaxID=158607 RepID=A0A2P5I0U7_DIAHE|nr:phospholipid-translocating P-type ATPase [Diaporthe helianthi]
MPPPKDDPDAEEIAEVGEPLATAPTRRTRWATRKLTVKSSGLKRLSLGARQHERNTSEEKKGASVGSETLPRERTTHGDNYEDGDGNSVGPRQLYFNLPLPDDLRDEQGNPKQRYARNKIRTSKYTPLSFVPENLWFQFHNVANIIFLFIDILVAFPIFGGVNPGLNAVPLIVIITITAIKDAVEDYRRTILDIELNNAPVHRLRGWVNVNAREDNVSTWRRTKKATSRFFGVIWHAIERLWKKPPSQRRPPGHSDARSSIDTHFARPQSLASRRSRRSFVSANEDIQMTPVPSPLPRENRLVPPEDGRPATSFSFEGPDSQLGVLEGDIINYETEPSHDTRFHRDAWKDLQVGDFVRLYNDEEIPADILVLSTSDSDGVCYIETKNLDGETNLKIRNALRCSRSVKHARDCPRAQFYIESEAPQPNLYQYNGAIHWEQRSAHDPDGEPRQMSEPITIDNILLRGCNLRNTEWALGVVLFTGHDTKIMMNAGITPSKRARIARGLNYTAIWNFAIVLLMCLVAAIVNGVTWAKTDASLAFFEFGSLGGTAPLTGFITYWAAMIVFQNLIPISLYISLEIVRTLQAFFIHSDVLMYHEPTDQPCIPKSWNISDDLGQVEYVFSDKTGTLTQNVMEFKKATINGQPYGEAYTEAQAGMQKRLGVDVEKEAQRIRAEIADAKIRALSGLRRLHANPYLYDDDLTFIAPDFVEDLAGHNGVEQQQATEEFMLALALCHTVIAENQPGDSPKMVFKAQSPDEAALVATARDMGFTVLSRTSNGINVNVMGNDRYYPILNTIEFNSSRKRMSTIVKMPDGKIVLYCKGADSIIYARLKRGEQQQLRRQTAEQLEMFAREGLRTLCVAMRVLHAKEYIEWRSQHDVAATALQGREDKLEEVADRIEQDLTLLGGTAIEDRLQDNVPETITLLGNAGIKLWVLTGDKVETAINIGFSCNLLNNDMDLIRLRADEDDGETADEQYLHTVEKELDKWLQAFDMSGSDEELKEARKNHEAPAPNHALIIDGFTLRWVLHDELKQKFLLLCKQCKSVLCCRVSPAQKAAIVSMVKNSLDVTTLAVGDGANDVAMIQEADIGVGIAGLEGRQAVMSSDYAIGQFRFLQRLVLVHGRWSYRRLAETISNFFYKNMIWTFAIFWFQIYCNFDITYLFEYTYILMFNLFFTSVPVILLGVLDQDVNDAISLAVPQLYRRGIERLEWSATKFWLYMLDGIYQSVMVFYIPYLAVSGSAFISVNGLDATDRLRLGVMIAHPAIITINLYILINTYRWDWIMLLVVVLSDLFIFLWSGAYTSTTYSGIMYKAASQLYSQLSFWLVFIVTPVVCIFPRFVVKSVQKVYFPHDVDIIREQITLGQFKEIEAAATTAHAPEAGEPHAVPMSTNTGSSDSSPRKGKDAKYAGGDEDRRSIYTTSVATHAQTGSDDMDYTNHSPDLLRELTQELTDDMGRPRPSIDRARPSYDRVRASIDPVRPSFEASNDFTSAARLSRIESSHSAARHPDHAPGQRRFNLTTVRKRGLSALSKRSKDP